MMFGKEAPMPTVRHDLGIAMYDGKIYAVRVGGSNPGLANTVNSEIFHPNNQIF